MAVAGRICNDGPRIYRNRGMAFGRPPTIRSAHCVECVRDRHWRHDVFRGHLHRGPRVTALLFSLTSPFALALGYLVFGETITGQQALGVALVLCGVVLAIGVPRGFLKRSASRPPLPAIAPAAMPLTAAQEVHHRTIVAWGGIGCDHRPLSSLRQFNRASCNGFRR
jgi:hypothetical protein